MAYKQKLPGLIIALTMHSICIPWSLAESVVGRQELAKALARYQQIEKLDVAVALTLKALGSVIVAEFVVIQPFASVR